MRDPLRIDKVSLGGGLMGAVASIACMMILLRVPGMNWFLAATVTLGVVFGIGLAYFRRR